MARLFSLVALALALAFACVTVHPVAAALGDEWPSVTAARRAIARLSGGGATVSTLCAVSNCERSSPLPTPPGGKFARFGPYDTRLVYLDGSQTAPYGFPSAVVACPVLPVDTPFEDDDDDEDRASSGSGTSGFVDAMAAAAEAFVDSFVSSGREGSVSGSGNRRDGPARAEKLPDKKTTTKKLESKNLPGLAWSSGGNGSCLGTDGFANAADGWSETVAGDGKGYWLPDALRHAASWGIITICPRLAPGIPVGDGSATRSAAKMLADVQPCGPGVKVDKKKLAVAGYSLGGGRALRGAAGDRDGVISAVVAVHPWGAPNGFFADRVKVPVLFLSATEDTNAPFRDSEATYNRATGPKLIVALRGGNHYTSPRFWAGATISFLLSAFEVEPFFSSADAIVWGDGKQSGFLNDRRLTWARGDCAWWRNDARRNCGA